MALVSAMPRSFSKGREDDEGYHELVLSVSTMNARRQQALGAVGPTGTVLRSCSVGIGKMGRMDEDKPCEFEEVSPRVGSLYLRRRSQAVGRRNVMFY